MPNAHGKRAIIVVSLALAGCAGVAPGSVANSGQPIPRACITDSPPQARKAGYVEQTFASCQASFPQDTAGSAGRGRIVWFRYKLFGKEDDGSVTIDGGGDLVLRGGTSPNANIASVLPAKGQADKPFYGVAFGGGGYFEAELEFDPKEVQIATGWPAWWLLSLESVVGHPKNTQWDGMPPGFNHQIEVDVMEFLYQEGGGALTQYGGTVHDWYGFYKKGGRAPYDGVHYPYASRTPPVLIKKGEFHRYGFLWQPAKGDEFGRLTFYFDGTPLGQPIEYIEFDKQTPPFDSRTRWAYGVIDKQHLILILGAGRSTPMRVRAVNVWQADRRMNINGIRHD